MKESRRDWMVQLFTQAGARSSHVKNSQFWRHDNKPIELWSPAVIEQKANYIHHNPVAARFVFQAHQCRYSSATDSAGGKGMRDIDFL